MCCLFVLRVGRGLRGRMRGVLSLLPRYGRARVRSASRGAGSFSSPAGRSFLLRTLGTGLFLEENQRILGLGFFFLMYVRSKELQPSGLVGLGREESQTQGEAGISSK